jgi:hypothetical protein
MMKRMRFIDRQTRPSTESTNAYNNIFVDQLNPSFTKAMRQFFPDPQGGRPRRRARQRA